MTVLLIPCCIKFRGWLTSHRAPSMKLGWSRGNHSSQVWKGALRSCLLLSMQCPALATGHTADSCTSHVCDSLSMACIPLGPLQSKEWSPGKYCQEVEHSLVGGSSRRVWGIGPVVRRGYGPQIPPHLWHFLFGVVMSSAQKILSSTSLLEGSQGPAQC